MYTFTLYIYKKIINHYNKINQVSEPLEYINLTQQIQKKRVNNEKRIKI